MDPVAAAVLREFAAGLAREEDEVDDAQLDGGTVRFRRGDTWVSLHLPEQALLALIPGAAEPWGGSMTDEDGAVALLWVHLDESLATREPHETGWWTYGNGFFHPVPPWEAHPVRDRL